MASSSRIALENWLKTINVSGAVLDIGGSVCGLKGRTKTFEPTSYKILDNNSEKNLHDQWTKPDFEADICKAKLCLTTLPFDQVYMIEVSEYLIDPIMALLNIRNLLKDGGEFYSSWHFLYPRHHPLARDTFRYTPDGVERLLMIAGFKDIKITPRIAENEQNLFNFYSGERMRAAKGEDHSIIGSLVRCVK